MLEIVLTREELAGILGRGTGYLYNDFTGLDPQKCPIHKVGCSQLKQMLRARPGRLEFQKFWSDSLDELLVEIRRRNRLFSACRMEPHLKALVEAASGTKRTAISYPPLGAQESNAALSEARPAQFMATPEIDRVPLEIAAMAVLEQLAEAIKVKNDADQVIAQLLGRPAQLGHAGEFIASRIFGIKLHESATNRGSDGVFTRGPLAGRSVNVKWYPRHEMLLDVNISYPPDEYLVLAGPAAAAASSRGASRSWHISSVFLFSCQELHEELKARGVKMGTATSVTQEQWRRAEIYPESRSSRWSPTESERTALALFGIGIK